MADGATGKAPAEAPKAPAKAPKAPAKAGKAPAEAPARRPAKLPSLQEAEAWIGQRVDGTGSRTIGRVAGIHVDAADGEPRWVVVRLGPIAGCTAIPFGHVAEGAGRLWAAYERDWVREAPRFKPREALTADNEVELCAHWGIRPETSRAAEVAHRDADEISAIPAGD